MSLCVAQSFIFLLFRNKAGLATLEIMYVLNYSRAFWHPENYTLIAQILYIWHRTVWKATNCSGIRLILKLYMYLRFIPRKVFCFAYLGHTKGLKLQLKNSSNSLIGTGPRNRGPWVTLVPGA